MTERYGQAWTLLLLAIWLSGDVECDGSTVDAMGRDRLKEPNIILFVADDMGWGDLSSYGHPTQEYGAIDRLAQEGMRFTQWYAPAVFCTPSRAAMLTGRLPLRSGMIGPEYPVLYESHTTGLPHEEVTMAEVLKEQNYITGIVGKWHLGINKNRYDDAYHFPHTHGFDSVGTILPMSLLWECDTTKTLVKQPNRHRCYIYYNTTIVQQPIDLSRLLPTLLHDAKAFLHSSYAQNQPFFLYMSFPQTHTAMINNPRFDGSSIRGPYGDQINEMAWAIDDVMRTVKTLGVDRKTLTVFISDHGPHKEICQHGGVTGILKGGKGNFWEGGIRVPAIAHWPGVIEPGTVSMAPISSMDLFNTFIDLAGGQVPNDRHIDGKSIKDILLGQKSSSAANRDILYFFCDDILVAVRYKEFKIHYRILPVVPNYLLKQFCPGGFPKFNIFYSEKCAESTIMDPPLIYNLETDPGEQYPLEVDSHRSELALAQKLILQFEKTLPELPQRLFNNEYTTSSVKPCCNPPYCFCNFPGTPPKI